MSNPQRQRLLLYLAAACIGVLVLDSLVLTPAFNYWKRTSSEIATLRKNITAGRSAIERADRTQSLWREMQRAALPAEVAQAEQSVLSNFDRWGGLSGVEISSIKPKWKKGANDRYSTLECRIDATGALSAVTRFMYEIETSPLSLRIETVEMGSRDSRGAKITLGLVVSGLRLNPLETKP